MKDEQACLSLEELKVGEQVCLKALREARLLGYWKESMECPQKRRSDSVIGVGEQGA